MSNIKTKVCYVLLQAVECRLSGLTEDLSHEAKWTFNDMVREKLLDCKFLKRVRAQCLPIHSVLRSALLVEC